jgi:hypothetical protein
MGRAHQSQDTRRHQHHPSTNLLASKSHIPPSHHPPPFHSPSQPTIPAGVEKTTGGLRPHASDRVAWAIMTCWMLTVCALTASLPYVVANQTTSLSAAMASVERHFQQLEKQAASDPVSHHDAWGFTAAEKATDHSRGFTCTSPVPLPKGSTMGKFGQVVKKGTLLIRRNETLPFASLLFVFLMSFHALSMSFP